MTKAKRARHRKVRDQEMRWLAENEAWLEAEHPGKWVAIQGENLAAIADDPERAEADAVAKGFTDSVIAAVRTRDFQGVILIRQLT